MTGKDKKQDQDISFTSRSELGDPTSDSSESRPPSSELERQKILIVDDKKENLAALRQVLAGMGVEIIEATSGNEALAAILDHRFAVAILDVMMPEMDGYELADQLRGDPNTRNIPIIFLTAVYSDEKRIFKSYEVGAVDYIVKPYNPDVLRSKVRVFLDLSRVHAELAEKIAFLTASEERFRSLVTTIPYIVYRIDADGRFTYLNDAVHSLGYTQEELLGSHFSKIVFPADMDNVSRELVLPSYSGRSTGPEDAPRLFDERRTGKRKTMGLEVRLVPRIGGKTLPAELHSGGPDFITVEINSSGIYAGTPSGNKTVFLGAVGVIQDITERKRTEGELEKYRDKLEKLVRERVMEQACLYGISEVLAEQHKVIDDVLLQVVDLIPSGWQYSDIACARLRLDDRTVTSKPFRESRWRLAGDIVIAGQTRGTVEVFYMEERPTVDQGPFLKEEKDLITGIRRLLGQAVDRTEAMSREVHLNAVLRCIRDVNQLIIREKQRDRFIRGVCDNLVTLRDFQGAWIVLIDHPSKEGMETAFSGFEDAVFDPLAAMLRKGRLPACCRPSQAGKGVVVTDNPAVACKGCPLAHAYARKVAMTVGLCHNDQLHGWLGISAPAEFASDPEAVSMLSDVASDVAFALHNMDIELKRSRYAQIVASSSEAMALVDREYFYLEANSSYSRLVTGEDTFLAGRSLEDVLGKAFFQDVVKPRLDRCFAGDEVRFETALGDSGATPRFLDALYTPCFGDEGTVSAVAVCNRDITEQKRAEEALRRSEQELSIRNRINEAFLT
ncbi:MAG: response regulator, partial [Deltaproteobacteria bacterium]|nr:response regulator [Deltaproteobacteria bacterium]